jgi:ABC-type transport system involved in multi-copper enzyme maturation permease subunit
MIRNPIIHKEVLSALRTRKALAMQAAYLLVTAGLIWLLWPAGGLQDYEGNQAKRIFNVLAIGQVVLVALFAPTFTAASLTSEKERNTWESLYATAMRPWEIALGKMVGSLAFLLLVVLTGSVALAAPLLLGGVSPGAVLAAMGLLLLTAIYLGMVGLLISAISHRSYRAIILTYAVLGVVVILVALPAWPISRNLLARVGPAGQAVMHTIASLSPLQAMLSLVLERSAYTTGSPEMPPFWQMHIALGIAAIVVIGIVCLRKLHRPVAPPRPREKLQVVERGQISARTFLFLFDPRKRKRAIAFWQNPVLMKEFRSRPMLQMHRLLRALAICLIASIVLMFLVTLSVSAFVAESTQLLDSLAAVVSALIVVLIILVGPAMTSGAVCSDIESGVWDLMRTTRLSSAKIVSGKFQASIIPLVLLVLATAPALVILLYFRIELWPNVLRVGSVAAMTVAFVATCGLLFSSLFKRTPTATAWTYAVVLTLGLATLLILLGGDQLFSRQLRRWAFVLNPVAAALDAAGYPPMQKLDLVPTHLRIFAVTTGAMLLVSVVRVVQLRRPD